MSTPTEDLVSRIATVYREAGGERFATGLAALFAPESWATAFTGGDDRWYGPEAILITGARFGDDTVARRDLDRRVDATAMWAAIDACWSPTTTAANRVGMKHVTDQKGAPGTAQERYRPIMERQAPDCQMWSWEVAGLTHLAGRQAVDDEFWAPLFPLIPDFVEAVERVTVFGNALLMVQNPAGTFTDADGRRTFSAWDNLDVYVFEGDRVHRLFFARDTLKDETQMLAALRAGPPPGLAGSIHLAPFATAGPQRG